MIFQIFHYVQKTYLLPVFVYFRIALIWRAVHFRCYYVGVFSGENTTYMSYTKIFTLYLLLFKKVDIKVAPSVNVTTGQFTNFTDKLLHSWHWEFAISQQKQQELIINQMTDGRVETSVSMSVMRRRPSSIWWQTVHSRAAAIVNALTPKVDWWIDGTSMFGKSTERRRACSNFWCQPQACRSFAQTSLLLICVYFVFIVCVVHIMPHVRDYCYLLCLDWVGWLHRSSQGVQWVHVHPQGGEKFGGQIYRESCKCTLRQSVQRPPQAEQESIFLFFRKSGRSVRWEWLI